MCPTVVPTSATWVRALPSFVRSVIAFWAWSRVVVDLAVAGVKGSVAQPVLDLADALDDRVREVLGALGDLLSRESQQQHDGAESDQDHEQRGEPLRQPDVFELAYDRERQGTDQHRDRHG
jgi:hypothetical protein